MHGEREQLSDVGDELPYEDWLKHGAVLARACYRRHKDLPHVVAAVCLGLILADFEEREGALDASLDLAKHIAKCCWKADDETRAAGDGPLWEPPDA